MYCHDDANRPSQIATYLRRAPKLYQPELLPPARPPRAQRIELLVVSVASLSRKAAAISKPTAFCREAYMLSARSAVSSEACSARSASMTAYRL